MTGKVDQAASLRRAPSSSPATLPQSRKALCCMAIASGKGGVGKTFLCANLAVAFALLNKKVLVIDADLGLANADLMLGVSPKLSLQDAIFKGRKLEEVVVHSPYGVDLLAASSGAREMVSMGDARISMLVNDLLSFAADYDVLIFDCAAGIDNNVTLFIAAVPLTIVVAAPHPASIMDAYALTKVIHQENLCRHICLVVNMAESDAEGERVRDILKQVSESYLSKSIDLLGIIPSSRKARKAIQSRKPLLVVDPDDDAARRIRDIAKTILQKRSADVKMSDFNAQNIVGGLVGTQVGAEQEPKQEQAS